MRAGASGRRARPTHRDARGPCDRRGLATTQNGISESSDVGLSSRGSTRSVSRRDLLNRDRSRCEYCLEPRLLGRPSQLREPSGCCSRWRIRGRPGSAPDRSRYSPRRLGRAGCRQRCVRRAGFSFSRARGRRDDSALAPRSQLLEDSGATAVRATARELDLANRRIAVEHPDGRSETIAYDILIYALGSTIDRGAVPGLVEHAFSVANEQIVS